MDKKEYTESKIIKYDYQALYYEMFQLASDKEYSCFEEYANDFENFIRKELERSGLDFFTRPDRTPIFQIERDNFEVWIPESPSNPEEEEPFILCSMTCYHPLKHSEKPSGIIFEDCSFLQIDQTLAHSLYDDKMYIVFYSYHYGRMKEGTEKYFFRYDKESEYERESGSIKKLDYKPAYHFHGNSDDPHFPDLEKIWQDKFKDITEILSINLSRLQDKHGPCDYVS
ncbi:hypothetical protein BAU22_16835 [Bacillus sp. 4048]|uniref:DUF6516 family protein n=1 Tax=Bacillus TaxID=1386 RepID=UPI0008FDEF09|nr:MULTISPECIES: DUF6516 family protein [Bacillus]OJD46187.1 hypothetical protein BAU22_16835 [Bacillus sp. 4048]TCD27557.1 hypothetical protein E0D84_28860 [Bacillus wiedmannii]